MNEICSLGIAEQIFVNGSIGAPAERSTTAKRRQHFHSRCMRQRYNIVNVFHKTQNTIDIGIHKGHTNVG